VGNLKKSHNHDNIAIKGVVIFKDDNMYCLTNLVF
jgi:hypothetical protein